MCAKLKKYGVNISKQVESVLMHAIIIIFFNIVGVIWTSMRFICSNLNKISYNSFRQ